ncbi:hypothetical protein NDU88_004093 [Pleurodeles waltl]|uniref:Uncharacterized protein n=1 Tax=Pleurodeles waltl TaxID=8319 RepID=A0AAV7QEY1_PLEWA|nr:hypothetical protein NDU88_004093 [Pleurodeles waltl]
MVAPCAVAGQRLRRRTPAAEGPTSGLQLSPDRAAEPKGSKPVAKSRQDCGGDAACNTLVFTQGVSSLTLMSLPSSEAMPSGKSSGKHSYQLHFSEAIAQLKIMATQPTPSSPTTVPAVPRAVDGTDCMLQEITVVGGCLEAKDIKISDLSPAFASIRTDIACFSEEVADLDQCLTTVEEHVRIVPEHDTELRIL